MKEVKRPGPPKKEEKRQTIYATVSPTTAKFINTYRDKYGIPFGKTLDDLVSEKFGRKIDE